jgi:hypothetical protein
MHQGIGVQSKGKEGEQRRKDIFRAVILKFTCFCFNAASPTYWSSRNLSEWEQPYFKIIGLQQATLIKVFLVQVHGGECDKRERTLILFTRKHFPKLQ